MQKLRDEVAGNRNPNYDVQSLLVNRWSPRAMTGEAMDREEFMPLFEAARWAPSCFNAQPWRFIYVERDSDNWDDALGVLNDKNQRWANKAALLTLVVSRREFEHNGNSSHTHSFDAGAAWENLALEATARGYVSHGMNGYNKDEAIEVFDVPKIFRPEAMIAIGKRGKRENLPEEQVSKEVPNGRKDLNEIVFRNTFK